MLRGKYCTRYKNSSIIVGIYIIENNKEFMSLYILFFEERK